MSNVIELSNGHEIETILFNGVCVALKNAASIIKVHISDGKKKYSENIWVGMIAIRKLWIKSIFSKYEMESTSCELLSQFLLCNNDGSITDNIRDIILYLCHEENGNIVMVIPPINDKNDPIPAQEIINLGPVPDFAKEKNPR